jgi:quercetin dioxygenase-like cupin family protein
MEPLLAEMDAYATSGDAAYRHFGQEFVFVLKGTIEIDLNKTKYTLKKGDSIYFNSSIPHAFRNLGKLKAEALWVITPPTF